MPARSTWSRAAVLALAALAIPCPAAGAAALMRSGTLAAQVDERGTVRFLQREGTTLRQAAGSLRFHADGRWRRATRLVGLRRPGRAIAVTLAAGRGQRAELRLERGRSGVLALRARLRGAGRVDAVSMAFHAPAGERYFGFGERSNAVAQRATVVENYVSDGPFSAESRDVVKATIPPGS